MIDGKRILPLCAAVLILIRLADRETLPVGQNERTVYVLQEKADLYVLGDELHGDVIAYTVDGNGGVFFNPADDAV